MLNINILSGQETPKFSQEELGAVFEHLAELDSAKEIAAQYTGGPFDDESV